MVFQCLLFIDSIEKRGASEKTKNPPLKGRDQVTKTPAVPP